MKKETIEKIFKEGIDLNGFILLSMIKNGEDFLSLLGIKRIEGLMNVIQRKGLVTDKYKLTESGDKLLQEIGVEKVPALDVKSLQDSKESSLTDETTFEAWTIELLAKLKGKLKEIIGKEQVMGFGKTYFIPGILDLRIFLLRFNKTYKISLQDNKGKIEQILIKHVTRCAKQKSFSPAVKYFIIKEGTGSQLASALESFEDSQDDKITTDKPKVVDIKGLF